MPEVIRSMFLAAYMCLFVGAAFSQDNRVAVSVTHTGDDSVGRQFVYAVREQIRGSRAFKLTSVDDSGLQVRIVTLNPDDRASSSLWTVASVVLTMTNFIPYEAGNPQTWYPIYLSAHVVTVGSNRTEEQARSIVASVDAALEKYRQEVRR